MAAFTEKGAMAFFAALDAAVRVIEQHPVSVSPQERFLAELKAKVEMQAHPEMATELGLSEEDVVCMQALHDALLGSLRRPRPRLRKPH